MHSWLAAFLGARSLSEPDGRRLYAYRCTDAEFAELAAVVRTETAARGSPTRSDRELAALFCLFAASWWGRNHAGGPWKWEGILADAGWSEITPQQLYPIIERGLKYWGLRVLRRGSGARVFLITLACEGGLPLKLVHKENASLRRYFRALIVDFSLYAQSGIAAEKLAEGVDSYLPRSLRNDIVYELSGQLISEIWQLHARVSDTTDPVQALDRIDPGWRRRMPLEMEDSTAAALLTGLVHDVADVTRTKPSGIRASRYLTPVDNGWQLSSEVEFPSTLSLDGLRSLIGDHSASLGSRFEIYQSAANADERTLVAMATQTRPGGDYRLEIINRAKRTAGGPAAARGHSLVFAGRQGTPIHADVRGGSPLSDMPWVFVDKHGDGESLELVGEGSVRTRFSTAYVAYTEHCTLDLEASATREDLSQIVGVNRQVSRITGRCSITDSEGTHSVVHTEVPNNQPDEYRLEGAGAPFTAGGEKVYLGCPRLAAFAGDVFSRHVAPTTLEWRPRDSPSEWQPTGPRCIGSVDIRHVYDGELRYRARAHILPPSAQVRFETSSDYLHGAVVLLGFDDADVATVTQGVRSVVRHIHDARPSAIRVDCHASGEPPAAISVAARWSQGQRLTFDVPYPSSAALFLGRDGSVLPSGRSVALDRLAGIRAVATAPAGTMNPYVEGSVRANDFGEIIRSRRLEVHAPLYPVTPGRYEVDLVRLKASLERLFSMSSDLDVMAVVEVHLGVSGEGRGRRLEVRRFDIAFELDFSTDQVAISQDDFVKLTVDELVSLRVEAIPLWDPTAEPVRLEPLSGGPVPTGRWRFDSRSKLPGPWLILAWEGSWCRSRPTLWPIADQVGSTADINVTAPPSPLLTSAIRVENKPQRLVALGQLLDVVADDPTSSQWAEIYEYAKAFRGVPATTLDLFDQLAKHPDAAVTGLLNATDAIALRALWELLEQLPFCWHLIPLTAWTRAAIRSADRLRSHLSALDSQVSEPLVRGVFQTFREHGPAVAPFLELISDWVHRYLFHDDAASTKYLHMATHPLGRQQCLSLLAETRNDCIRSHVEDRWWPNGTEVSTWYTARRSTLPRAIEALWHNEEHVTQYRLSVLNAPIVAALADVFEGSIPQSLQHELMMFRAFDRQWFDEAHAFAIAYAMGLVLERDPGAWL